MDSTDAGGGWHPGHNPWAIALTVTLATFMEVLDTSIANVALPHIAGGLSATQDEATWVLTSYLVSNAVVLPVSGWAALRFGRKRFYMTCVALFTVSSLLCGIAPSLGWLVFFRVLQGAGGGGLAPSEQSILADTFAPSRRGMAFGIYGMAVVVAPAVGPTLGGFLTDTVGWRWIFFLNVPVGIVSLLLTKRMVTDPPYLVCRRKEPHVPVDFVGLALVTLGFGALQIVLDKGQEDDWFGSGFIRGFSCVAAVSIVSLVWWELRYKHPIVDLRLLGVRNFGLCNALLFLTGVILFGSTVLLPQFEQVLLGYTAEKAGETLSLGGLFILPLMPLVGWLVGRISARWLIALGFVISAVALRSLTNLDLDVSFGTLAGWRVIQATGIAFLFVPITATSYVGLPSRKTEEGSALLNLSRNLGGSVGISFIESFLARRAQVHQNFLVSHTSGYHSAFRGTVSRLTDVFTQGGVNAVGSVRMAYATVYRQLLQQASALAYVDICHVLSIGSLCAIPVALLLRPNIVRRRPAHGHA